MRKEETPVTFCNTDTVLKFCDTGKNHLDSFMENLPTSSPYRGLKTWKYLNSGKDLSVILEDFSFISYWQLSPKAPWAQGKLKPQEVTRSNLVQEYRVTGICSDLWIFPLLKAEIYNILPPLHVSLSQIQEATREKITTLEPQVSWNDTWENEETSHHGSVHPEHA